MSASYHRASYIERPSARRRATSGAMSVGVVLLLLLMLLKLGAPLLRRPDGPGLATFNVTPDPEAVSAHPRPHTAAKKSEKGASSPTHQATPTQPQARVPTPPLPETEKPAPNMIVLSKDEYAASDIGKLPSHAGEGSADSGAGKDSTTVYGPGEGPGGASLYNAEWVREPTTAEMAFYMPKTGAPSGAWAMVACQTIERFHVDNCRELGESPPGSHLSRALREAAWQFLVRPPRINGKTMVGAWVRIRFDFTEGHVVR